MRTVLIALLLCACKSGTATSSLTGASVITAEAIGASVVSRSQGGCIAMCTNGTICNPRTGLCEHPACDNACGRGERCEVTYKGNQCVSNAATGVVTQAPGANGAAGVAPINQPPDANHASPTIVPTAEKQ